MARTASSPSVARPAQSQYVFVRSFSFPPRARPKNGWISFKHEGPTNLPSEQENVRKEDEMKLLKDDELKDLYEGTNPVIKGIPAPKQWTDAASPVQPSSIDL